MCVNCNITQCYFISKIFLYQILFFLHFASLLMIKTSDSAYFVFFFKSLFGLYMGEKVSHAAKHIKSFISVNVWRQQTAQASVCNQYEFVANEGKRGKGRRKRLGVLRQHNTKTWSGCTGTREHHSYQHTVALSTSEPAGKLKQACSSMSHITTSWGHFVLLNHQQVPSSSNIWNW